MNTVQATINVNDALGEVRLSLNNPISKDKIWIFVEGEDDIKIYPKFFINENVIFRQTEGSCYKLPEVIRQVLAITPQIIGIKDADFDRLEHKDTIENLFITDFHDVEMMMVAHNSTLNNIFAEHLILNDCEAVRNTILEQIKFLGFVRWYNNYYDIEIKFKGLGLNRFYDGNSDFDIEKCINELNIRSSNRKKDLCIREIQDFINNTSITEENLMELCNGHDFCKMLTIHLFCHVSTKVPSYKDIEKSLRLSYKDEFYSSNLYNNIKEWSNNNTYNILKF